MTLCQSIFMELARDRSEVLWARYACHWWKFPHHPSGGARAGEHRADAEGAVDLVRQRLTLAI